MLDKLKVKRYYEQNEIKKGIEKELKELNTEIKGVMAEAGESVFEVDSYKVEIVEQDRGKMNEEKLALLLLQKGFMEAVEFKPVPKATAVEDYLFDGRLQAEEVQACYEPKIIEMLKISLVKKKGGKKSGK